jgi:hypothetical protein
MPTAAMVAALLACSELKLKSPEPPDELESWDEAEVLVSLLAVTVQNGKSGAWIRLMNTIAITPIAASTTSTTPIVTPLRTVRTGNLSLGEVVW